MNLKQTFLLLALAYTTIASAQTNLPFVGKRFFNFVGGRGEQMCIIIKKDGTTIIQSATGNEGPGGAVVEFKGKYSSLIKTKYGYYKIKDGKIMSVDSRGNVEKGCSSDENQPCIAELVTY